MYYYEIFHNYIPVFQGDPFRKTLKLAPVCWYIMLFNTVVNFEDTS